MGNIKLNTYKIQALTIKEPKRPFMVKTAAKYRQISPLLHFLKFDRSVCSIVFIKLIKQKIKTSSRVFQKNP